MSGCTYFQELISRVLDGELSPDEQETLNGHLSGCTECRALYQSFRALSGALSGDLEEPPERLRYAVMAELRRAEIKKKNRLSRPGKVLLSAAACVALIVGLSIGSNALRARDAELAAPQDSFVLAGSNFAASARSLPNGETRAAGALPEAASEAETPAAAFDTAACTEEADTMMDMDAAVFDLSGRFTKEELLDFLGCTYVDLRELPSQALCRLIVSDGGAPCTVTVYELDGELIYTLPDRGAYLADCSRAELETLLRG